MSRRSGAVVAVLTALGVIVATPARADEPRGRCNLSVEDTRTSGQNTTGLIDAVVFGHAGEWIHVECTVQVNGTAVVVAARSGNSGVAFAEAVSYAASETDTVQICSAITTAHGTFEVCADPEPVRFGDRVASAVVGYIQIVHTWSIGPTYTLAGALADPSLWYCWDEHTSASYRVRCIPQAAPLLTWRCDVLHADVATSGSGVARTTLDCNDGATEARTMIVSGDGGFDSVLATSSESVSTFTCTVDRGVYAGTPDYTAGCGDPGAPQVE